MDLIANHNPPELIAARTQAIREAMLRESRHVVKPNFTSIQPRDLARLFGLYDTIYFNGWLDAAVKSASGSPPTFRLSNRMTSTGGKMIRHRAVLPGRIEQLSYQIAIASRLLFDSFKDDSRPVTVCGLICADRLSALQRIMEHEILHLAEMLVWGDSSCSAGRFRRMARNIFGHADTKHDLITPREHAAVQHDVRVGQQVEFEFDGADHIGNVNRINRRATVLVESPEGEPYSNGRKYLKFYVPVQLLRPVPSPA